MNLLFDALYLAFWVTFVVAFVRALPWPKNWKQRKPLACDACMVGWVLIGLVLYREAGWRALFNGSLFSGLVAGGMSLILLGLLRYFRGLEPPE